MIQESEHFSLHNMWCWVCDLFWFLCSNKELPQNIITAQAYYTESTDVVWILKETYNVMTIYGILGITECWVQLSSLARWEISECMESSLFG